MLIVYMLCDLIIMFFSLTASTIVCIALSRYPVVSLGVLRWVEHTLSDLTVFEEAAESSPLFLVLLDEVRTAKVASFILLTPVRFYSKSNCFNH